jgi:hypothetical protein
MLARQVLWWFEMILFVHHDRNFDKRLAALHRAGGHALLAARNAEEIIANIANGAKCLETVGRQTKYGEARIKNCLKFNLGNGYRLVTVRKRTRVILLYIGTHDECDRWLEGNRGHNPAENMEQGTLLPAGESKWEDLSMSENVSESPNDEYEELLLKKIDQKILKRIFKGLLCENP